MSLIHVLDESTINQIAAGEVVERPSAVVKELIENAMDAGATAITAEIKDGGLSFIRITDNGCGIAREDIPLAFLRHATSKIRSAQDLFSVTSLGFRGEALSSVASVAQLELITKTPTALNGYRYIIEGGEEKSLEEIGCPGGTTIIVRNLFYNTPARRKFLKAASTEAGYVSDLMERLMVSHPGVSFKFIMNNQVKLQSSGNNNSKDILYQVYGRDITRELLTVNYASKDVKITGFLGKPVITRGNRNYENYFINGRYIKSNIITKAIEEAYKPFLMQHKYPFTSLYFEISPALIDVNVHPQKMEIRLNNSEEVYQLTFQAIRSTLTGKELIPRVLLSPEEEMKKNAVNLPEPFEENRRKQFVDQENTTTIPVKPFSINYDKSIKAPIADKIAEPDSSYRIGDKDKIFSNTGINDTDIKDIRAKDTESLNIESIYTDYKNVEPRSADKIDLNIDDKNTVIEQMGMNQTENYTDINNPVDNNQYGMNNLDISNIKASEGSNPVISSNTETDLSSTQHKVTIAEQMSLFANREVQSDTPFLSKKAFEGHKIIGQVFSTYWLVEYNKELYIIDQHAAHEKVLYERIMATAKTKAFESQQLLPPIVLSLTLREQEVFHKYEDVLSNMGYEIEHFGGNEFSVRAVPTDLYSISEKELLMELIDALMENSALNAVNSTSVLERVASLSCKAAVKANHTLSYEEASALIKELLTLENPYHCPHGRPVIISMSQYELERKFKRIL